MNNVITDISHNGSLIPIAALSACFGILLVGALVFFYLYMRSSRKLHLATLMIVLPGIAFVGSEISCLLLGIMNETAAAMQMHRVQALSTSTFLFTVPYFFGYFLDIGPSWRKVNSIIMYVGLCVLGVILVTAFVSPDHFISVTKMRSNPLRTGWGIGRGEHGLLFSIRDILLLILMSYCVWSIILGYSKRKQKIYLMYVLGGVILAVLFAVYDILFFHGVIHWHGGEYVNYSFAGFGFTIFLTLSMTEVLRQFLDQGRELERARKLESLGIFAGGIAHDFNNVLTSIMGSISIVKKRFSSGSHEYSLLNDAEKASRRARDLIQQLLTFSRGGAPVKSVVSLEDLVNETAGFVLGGSDVRCECSFPQGLWNINADRSQIGQVLYNIMLNARQAMTRGGTISVTAENSMETSGPDDEKSGRYVRVYIRDQGTGISRKNMKDIYVPYFTTRKEGSGLGLSISRSIIRKHGGDIQIKSREGEGTTVEFTIPAAPEREREEKAAPAAQAGGGRILLMDDDALICEVSSEMLKLLGYDVEIASSGEEAVEMYRKACERGEPFDCVIMDLTIPGGMDGSETLAVLREYDPRCRAIVSSGYSDDPVMAHYREYGFAGICPKPYSIDALEWVLADVLKA
ncbi:MAG TPA: ATP-binding protein [Spirochaetota bacterium]|nr:ATP-binding protein [Spirochaetota bacterium]